MNNKTESNSPIDHNKLDRWLNRNAAHDGRVSLISVKVPTNGYSATTALIDAEIAHGADITAHQWVLRLEKQGQHIFLDTDIAHQGRMMKQLAAHDLPAPTVLTIESDPTALGGKCLLMERIDGVALPQNPNYHVAGLLPRLTEGQRHRAWGEAISTIAAINRLDWRQGFEFLDKPQYGQPGLSQYLGWLNAWRNEAMDGKPNPIIDAALDRLSRDMPDNPHVDVLWGDSNPGNFLFDKDGRVAAVLDFEASALGPAEIDLGWWFYVDSMISFGAEPLSGLPDRDETIALFETTLGRKVTELPYYEMLAAVRMALVIARTAHLLIERGALPPDNRSACNNPGTHWLGMKMGIPGGEVGEDFMAFAMAMKNG